MNSTVTPPPMVADPVAKWEREFAAFERLLPGLLRTHRGRFVAIHDGDVVDSGGDKLILAMNVLKRLGNVAIHVGLVTDEPIAISRSGIRREVIVGAVS